MKDPFEIFNKQVSKISRAIRPNRFDEMMGLTSGGKPVSDIFENQSEVITTVELPGVKKENLKLNITNSGISLKVEEKSQEHKREKKHGIYTEYSSSRFSGYSQFLSFPTEVDASKAKATFKNGVLEVRVPKVHKGKGKEIKIE